MEGSSAVWLCAVVDPCPACRRSCPQWLPCSSLPRECYHRFFGQASRLCLLHVLAYGWKAFFITAMQLLIIHQKPRICKKLVAISLQQLKSITWSHKPRDLQRLATVSVVEHRAGAVDLTGFMVCCSLQHQAGLREVYLKQDSQGLRPPNVNETCCVRPQLAVLLDEVALQGPDALYSSSRTEVNNQSQTIRCQQADLPVVVWLHWTMMFLRKTTRLRCTTQCRCWRMRSRLQVA